MLGQRVDQVPERCATHGHAKHLAIIPFFSSSVLQAAERCVGGGAWSDPRAPRAQCFRFEDAVQMLECEFSHGVLTVTCCTTRPLDFRWQGGCRLGFARFAPGDHRLGEKDSFRVRRTLRRAHQLQGLQADSVNPGPWSLGSESSDKTLGHALSKNGWAAYH